MVRRAALGICALDVHLLGRLVPLRRILSQGHREDGVEVAAQRSSEPGPGRAAGGCSAAVRRSARVQRYRIGRARNLTEAILWHGGEAEGARNAFADLPKADRDVLLAFVNSL